MVTEMLWIAGFVVFLSVFGLRGLLISGAVFMALVWFLFGQEYPRAAKAQQERADFVASSFCADAAKGTYAGADVDRFICGPPPR